MALFVLALFWVPLYREFHFYFAHRFIHIKVYRSRNIKLHQNLLKAVYKYVHSQYPINIHIKVTYKSRNIKISIPIKAVYKYVHSLHHRNTDIEPFAGLSMHPVEHLYYYRLVNFVDLLNTHSESSFFLYVYCLYC